jgi:hypothetical protein
MSLTAKLLAYLILSLFAVSGAKAEWDGVEGHTLHGIKSR